MSGAGTTTLAMADASEAARDVASAATSSLVVSPVAERALAVFAETPLRFKGTGAAATRALGGSAVGNLGSGYLGAYRQGQTVALGVRTTGSQGRTAMPDAAPVADVYNDAGQRVASLALPLIDDDQGGVFALPLFLGTGFAVGRYRVAYRYRAGTFTGLKLDSFDVSPGGDPSGPVIGLFAYDRPEARYVVAQTADGTLIQGATPASDGDARNLGTNSPPFRSDGHER